MVEEPATGRTRIYRRETLEFERVAFFSDAIFAIAMTLLVVGLDPPDIADQVSNRELWDALDDMSPQLLMFFISFAVLGSFWLTHHRYVGRLAGVDHRATLVNLVYLAFIAFLPFPSAMLGQYSNNSVGVAVYATCIALIATLSWLLTEVATRHGLFRRPPPPDVIAWQRIVPLVPAAYFLASIPLAVFAPATALYSWILLFPLMALIQRRMPASVVAYFNE
jgi:TMEM175 potassium channel family protein